MGVTDVVVGGEVDGDERMNDGRALEGVNICGDGCGCRD